MVKAAEELAPTIHDLRRKGRSYREIAQTLGVSTKLVYNVLHSTPDTGGTGGMGDMGGNTWKHMGDMGGNTWKHLETPHLAPAAGNTPETVGNTWKHLETFPGSAGESPRTPLQLWARETQPKW